MTAYADAESYSGISIHSPRAGSRNAGDEPNSSRHADDELPNEGELKTAVSIATAQLGQDLGWSEASF